MVFGAHRLPFGNAAGNQLSKTVTTGSMQDPVVDAFLQYFGLRPARAPSRDELAALGQAFSRLPYENLSKLVAKHDRAGEARRRLPMRVLEEHLSLGAGGTCFALTALFLRVLTALGYQARAALCDTRHRPDNHCAVIITLPEGEYLLDPGYLIFEPIPLFGAERQSLPSHVALDGDAARDDRIITLSTYQKQRYRLKRQVITRERFFAVWDDSFDWTMMRNVHVSAALGSGYAYLHGHKLRVTTLAQRHNENLKGRQPDVLSARFGLDRDLVERAYTIVAREREPSTEPTDE
jgi:arylamine N-acetyltransferase